MTCGLLILQRPEHHRAVADSASPFTSTSLTTNTSVAFGGMTPPAPLSPYASCGGTISTAVSPTPRCAMPSSQPLITAPRPSGDAIGSFRAPGGSELGPPGGGAGGGTSPVSPGLGPPAFPRGRV